MEDFTNFIGQYLLLKAQNAQPQHAHHIVMIGDDQQIAPDEFSNEITCACGYKIEVHGLYNQQTEYDSFSIVAQPPANIPICSSCRRA